MKYDYRKYHGRKIWLASCRRLAEGLREGEMALEAGKDDLAFRWLKPVTGPVIRRNGHKYAAIVQKSDWPREVPLLRSRGDDRIGRTGVHPLRRFIFKLIGISVLLIGVAGSVVASLPHSPRRTVLLTAAPRELTPPEPTTTVPPALPERTLPRPAVSSRPPRVGGGSRQACILTRENPDDPTGNRYGRSTNPDHFGAYQFDKSTWATAEKAAGRSDPWGSATPEQQDAAFHAYVAKYGYGAWAPYDGC